MNEQLRKDNNEENCTVPSDPEGKIGRPHHYNWLKGTSNWRMCSTCGRMDKAGKGEDDEPTSN